MTENKQNKPGEKDHYWWVHPKLRGGQTLEKSFADSMKWQWSNSEEINKIEFSPLIDEDGPYSEFAKLLYKLNSYKTGPVKGWYVVVKPNNREYVVGQLCVDSNIPVCLFENEKFKTEDEAKSRAAELRALYPGLMHVS